jgi:hypothetical protein
MAYLGVCLRCNFHVFAPDKSLIVDELEFHGVEVHDRAEYTISWIPNSLYDAYRLSKGNPEFWSAIRNYRKLAKVLCRS